MIIGHYISPGIIRELIYSFHMPLFFFIGGYLYKRKPFLFSIKKDFKRLIVPYIITGVILLCYYYALGYKHNDFSTAYSKTLAILYGCGAEGIQSKYFSWIPTSSPLWFLLALFWCKNIYNVIPKYKVPIAICIGIIAIYLQYYVINFPLCVLLGCSAMVFYAIGNMCKERVLFERYNWIIVIICLLVWLYIGSHYGLYMYMSRWDNVLMNVIGAMCAIYLVFHLSRWLKLSIMEWLGRNSLSILCVHVFFFVPRIMKRFTENVLLLSLNDIFVSVLVIFGIQFLSNAIKKHTISKSQ